MKRFWTAAEAVPEQGGWAIRLDGRPVRTPARALLLVPCDALAEAITGEWNAVGEAIDPAAMPLTGLANAAIDRVAPDRQAFADGLARYGETDLLCYRAEGPASLVERQAAAWDPLLQWARRRFDVDFVVTSGILHVPQPPGTVERLAHGVTALDAFHLAALSPLVTIGGSLVAGLAMLEKAVVPAEAWDAISIDECWQFEQWGADTEAEAALEKKRRDFMAAASFITLLDA